MNFKQLRKMLTVKYCMHVQLNKDNSVATTSVSPDTYERLGMRVQKIINSPPPPRKPKQH